MLDLRVPAGAFFAITGAILFVYGEVSSDRLGAASHIDVFTGGAMAAFGAVLLLLARRSHKG